MYFLTEGNILGIVAKSSGPTHELLAAEEWESWNALLMLNRSVLRELDTALRRQHGLTVTEFDVLITLFNAPGLKMENTLIGSFWSRHSASAVASITLRFFTNASSKVMRW